jgi:Flp pilus assembly protein TadD
LPKKPGYPKPLTKIVKFLASTFDAIAMPPVQTRSILSRLILTGLLICPSLPSLAAAEPSDQTLRPASRAPIVQLANHEAATSPAAPAAADLAPAIAQLKAKNYAAAEALLLKLQAPDRVDAYQYLGFAQMLQGKYADLWITAIDRSYQGFDASAIEAPPWLAAAVAKPLKVLQSEPSPQLIAEIATRIKAQPEAIAPRLAYLILTTRPSDGSPTIVEQQQRKSQIQQQVQDLFQRHGKNSKVLAFLANIDFEQWDLDRQPLLEQTLALDPGQINVRQQLAMMHAAQGRFAEAQTLLTSGPEPRNPLLLQTRAQIQETIGDLPGALAIHSQLLAQTPDKTDHNTLLSLSKELGQFDQGLALYQAMSQRNPAIAAQGYSAAADQLLDLGDAGASRSLSLRQQAQRLDPKNSGITQQLIAAYRNEKKLAEALKLAEAFHKQNPADFEGSLQLLELLSPKQFDRAITLGQTLVKKDLDNAPAVLSNLLSGIMPDPAEGLSPGKLEAHYKKTNAAAIALTDRFVKQYPTQTESLYSILIGRLSGADALPQSLALYRKLEQLATKTGTPNEYAIQVAWLYQSNSQPDNAIAVLKKIIAKDPLSSDARIALGQLLITQDRIPEAIALLKPEIRKNPDLTFSATNPLQSNNHHKEAIELFELALKTKPNSPDILSDYGLSLEKTGQTDRAISTYRQALALTPKRDRNSAAVVGRLIYLIARQGNIDQAVTEALAIASATPKPIYLGDTINPFNFLSYHEGEIPANDIPADSKSAAHLDRRIYQAIISQLTSKGPSRLLAAAHEDLGQSLLAETSPADAIRQYETAEAIYRQVNSPDRAFALKRQITQMKLQQ